MSVLGAVEYHPEYHGRLGAVLAGLGALLTCVFCSMILCPRGDLNPHAR